MSKLLDSILIEDPTIEEGFNGMILGTPDMDDVGPYNAPFKFNFHAAAKYVREHNLPTMTEDVMALFKY